MGASKTHKAVQLLEGFNADPLKVATLVDTPTPSPGKDEVLVHMLCRPVNPSDLMALVGFYGGFQPKKFPVAVGLEGMGEVSAVGENVKNVKVGQRVFPMLVKVDETGQGSWQEYVVVPASGAILIPESLSDEIASQFFVNPWTVYTMLHHLEVPKGEYVIQSAGASTLGRMFIQLARQEGVKTISLVRRDEQIEELKALGADVVINYTSDDVAKRVKEATGGKMAHGGIDAVSGDVTQMVVAAVRNSGEVLVYGGLDGAVSKVGIGDLIFRDVRVHGWWVTEWIAKLSPSELQKTGAAVMDLLVEKVLQPHIGQKYPLSKFKEAVSKSQEVARGGKVFIINDH